MSDEWITLDWREVNTNWEDSAISIICPCGAELLMIAGDDDKNCRCGRTYRFVTSLQQKPFPSTG